MYNENLPKQQHDWSKELAFGILDHNYTNGQKKGYKILYYIIL